MTRTAFALAVLTAVFLAACAPDANPHVSSSHPAAGFWLGLWHGCIIFFSFILSLFYDSVGIYQIHNDGTWYNFGYLLGVLIAGGSGGGAAAKKKRKIEIKRF